MPTDITDDRIAAPGTPRFNIGRVLAVSLGLLGRNFILFVAITVLASIPSYLVSYWYQSLPVDPQQPPQHFNGHPVAFAVNLLMGLMVTATVQAALTYATLQRLRGHPAPLIESLRRGLTLLPKVAVTAVLWWLLVTATLLLLVVPGVIFAAIFWVVLPAIVVENAGILGAFGRSRALTKGRRWPIFGVFLLVVVLYTILEIVIFRTLGPAGLILLAHDPRYIIGMTAVSAIVMTFGAVMTAVGYYYLRAEKEGILIDDAARVFD